MSIVSVTRFRLRGLRYLPFFMIHAQRSLMQIRRTDGYLAGAVRRDRDLAYWTSTVWRDETALLAYVTSGAHRTAMPKLADWGDEASTVRWDQDGFDLPDWSVAIERMQRGGTGFAASASGTQPCNGKLCGESVFPDVAHLR